MATRYVWGLYSTKLGVIEGQKHPDGEKVRTDALGGYYWSYSSDYDISGSSITLKNVTSVSVGPKEKEFNGVPKGSIFVFTGRNKTGENVTIDLDELDTSYNDTTIRKAVENSTYIKYDSEHIAALYYTINGAEISIGDVKGTLQGYVSGASYGAYPQDGVSGANWYDYQGSDKIDPSACSIPSTIMGGTQITITVTPGTGKVYAGTVSYIYQVKLGSGSWTTIATTTATTRTYTVPYGTESIQVRVQAKDDIGFTSSDYVTSSSVTVINNQPPTAPGSIEVTNVVSGQQCTITITAATDPDGTVESYIYERSVDGSAWEQIANVNALTHNDTINAEWGTVAYRVKAVDDDGDSGPYVTSQTSVVNSGWVIISGPANDMGDKPAPFEFELSVSISGQETSDNITVDVTLDGKSVYSQAVAPNTPISIDVDTRTMRTGSHSFAVAATCDTYVPASGEYTFNVPEITIPDGGRMDQLEGQDGQVIFPITLARAVAGLENYGVESKVHPGAYTGTGTFGTDNPNTLEFEFEPKMVLIQGTAGRVAILIKPSGVGVSIGPNESTTLNVTWQGKTVSWYNALNAANQMNTENETYSYTAFG